MTVEELVIKIGLDAKEAVQKLDDFHDKVKNFGKSVSEASTPFLAAGGAIVGALTMSVKAAAESESAQMRLATALKATKQYSDEQVKSMLELSTKMEYLTGMSDEAFTRAQAYGLQLGLTTEQVKQLIPKITDFAVATGMDLESAIRLATRALEGNTGALGRYGIEVEKSKDGTVTFNNVLDAFKNFSGAAEARGKSLEGQLGLVREQFGDLTETVGAVLIPVIKDFITQYIEPLVKRLQEVPPQTLENAVKFTALAGGILMAVGVIGKLISLLSSLTVLFTPSGLLLMGIGAFILLIIKIVQHWEDIKKAFTGFYERYIKPWLDPLLPGLKLVVMGMGGIITAIVLVVKHWDEIKKAFAGFYERHVKPWLDPLIAGLKFVISLFEKIADWFKKLGNKIQQTVNTSASSMNEAIGNINWGGNFATGGEFTVSRPTLFVAGEAGKEHISITPTGERTDNTLLQEILKELRRFNNETAPSLARQIAWSVNGLGGKV